MNISPLSIFEKCTFRNVGCITENIKAPGNNVEGTQGIKNVINAAECQVKHCRPNDKCKYFAYVMSAKICFLKTENALDEIDHETGVKFGPSHCNPSKCSNY